jgi:hypothetical protein
MNGVSRWFVHTVTVEAFLGTNGYGEDVFDVPVILAPPNGCWVDNARKVVRNKDGIEVVSETSVATATANASLFTTNSRVTINGVASRVIKANSGDSGSLQLPTDHLEVNLL